MARDVRVRVKPGSRQGPSATPLDSPEADLLVHVRERAIEGRANAAVQRVVADHFGVPKSAVTVVRGHKAPVKTLRIDD